MTANTAPWSGSIMLGTGWALIDAHCTGQNGAACPTAGVSRRPFFGVGHRRLWPTPATIGICLVLHQVGMEEKTRLMRDAGFDDVRELEAFRTPTGAIAIVRAGKADT